MKQTPLLALALILLTGLMVVPCALGQNATSSGAPLQSTQPVVIAAIGAAAAVLFFVLLYKLKKKD